MTKDHRLGFKNGKSGAVITVRVVPRSSKVGISEILTDGTLKIRLSAAPIDGRANDELIKMLSKTFGCPKSNIEIIVGSSNKTKLVAIYGLDPDSVDQIISQVVKGGS
jgi:uncharacterized protein